MCCSLCVAWCLLFDESRGMIVVCCAKCVVSWRLPVVCYCFGACCVLCIVCVGLMVVWCLLLVVSCVMYVVRYELFVVCCLMFTV